MTGELEAVTAALGQLPDDAGQVPDGVLAGRMRQLMAVRAMADAALVEQLRVFDAGGGAGHDGQTSTYAWLRAGRDGADLLRVARHLGGLPQLSKAFAAGEITLEHAAAVARLVGTVGAEALVDYEQILVELARQAPPVKLRTACDHLRQLLDPDGDGDEAARQRRRRYLSAGRTVDGMVHLQGLLDPCSGDVLLAALRAAMPVPGGYEERSAAQRRADALSDIAAGWMAAGQAPVSGGVRPQVQVTVSLRRLRSWHPLGLDTEQDRAARAAADRVSRPLFGILGPEDDLPDGQLLGDVPTLADGQPVSIGEARRLACDAGVIPVVLGSDGELLDIGRQSRVVPTGLRRALNLRDGGCRFDGCDRPVSWCDAHHIVHWADDGETSLGNCILLCAYHHSLIHEGWRLHGDPNQTIWFERPDGTRLDLASAPRGQPPTRGP